MNFSVLFPFILTVISAPCMPSLARASSWSEFDNVDLTLEEGPDECADGLFRYVKDNGQWNIRLGPRIQFSFKTVGKENSSHDVGKDTGCRYETKIKADDLTVKSVTQISNCLNGSANVAIHEALILKPNRSIEYTNARVVRGAPESSFVCMFKVTTPAPAISKSK